MRAYLMLSSLLALSSLGLSSRPAHAESSCNADSDCVKGWTCQVSGGTGCASPACAPGEKCDPGPSDCVTEVFKSCQPGACQADSDCASGMVCYSHTETNCPPIACAPGQTCPQPACPSQVVSACVPRYLLPCTTANDCGAGFQCESAGQSCACSGSGTADPGGNASGGSAQTQPLPPDCICEESKEMRCHAESVTCAADSDCSAGWTCAVVAVSGGCASAPAPAPTPNGSGSSGSAGSSSAGTPMPQPDCAAPSEIKQCVPPYYGLIQGARSVDLDLPSSPGESPAPSTGGPAPGAADNGTSNGTGVPPVAAEDGSQGDTTASAGCSVAHAPRTSPLLAVFGALGVLSVLRRRRAH
ncbi:MAG TPA: hypothetical protein VFK05_14995 [Polyangiaceae bacterium]|nr:hypothetical protein [Polyangiaceae bacterium]